MRRLMWLCTRLRIGRWEGKRSISMKKGSSKWKSQPLWQSQPEAEIAFSRVMNREYSQNMTVSAESSLVGERPCKPRGKR
jgi:hypothetical protein